MSNPFIMVYDTLWQMVLDRPEALDYISAGNQISFTDKRPRIKRTIVNSDLPELMLFTEGGTGNLHRSSNMTSTVRTYTWAITTGKKSLNSVLDIEFLLLRSLVDWKTKLTVLKWEEEQFVKRAQLLNAIEGESDAQRNRGIEGWSALWRCEIEFIFRTESLSKKE